MAPDWSGSLIFRLIDQFLIFTLWWFLIGQFLLSLDCDGSWLVRFLDCDVPDWPSFLVIRISFSRWLLLHILFRSLELVTWGTLWVPPPLWTSQPTFFYISTHTHEHGHTYRLVNKHTHTNTHKPNMDSQIQTQSLFFRDMNGEALQAVVSNGVHLSTGTHTHTRLCFHGF